MQKISIISLGDELLKGFTINTNSSYIGQKLLERGDIVSFNLTIRDKKNDIVNALTYGCENSDVIITTGGLGPTKDDITKDVISEFFKLELYRNADAAKNIENYFEISGRIPSEYAMQQAYVPNGSVVFKNKVGLAPGILMNVTYKNQSKKIIMLPGPPQEMKAVFAEVLNYSGFQNKNKTYSKMYLIAGLPESEVERRSEEVVGNDNELELAYCANLGFVKLFLTHKNKENFTKATKIIEEEFSYDILEEGVNDLTQDVIALLKSQNATIATAESCTGGMIAASITDNSGVSDIFPGSIVVYSNKEKIKLLNVSEKTLEKYGAVSAETAKEMIINVVAKFTVDAGIAVTGIAGPTGGTDEKPVGLVYIAVAYKDKQIIKKYNFHGNREVVRTRTMISAFNELRKLIKLTRVK